MMNKVLQHNLRVTVVAVFLVQPFLCLCQDIVIPKFPNGSSSQAIPFSLKSSSPPSSSMNPNIVDSQIMETCDPPCNLWGDMITPGYNIYLAWDSPSGCGGFDEWIYYDDGVNNNAYGITEGGSFMVAIRFEQYQLAQYSGGFITEVKIFLGSSVYATEFVLMIWKGDNASHLIYVQSLSDIAIGDWNTIILTSPVWIDISRELWIGYACNNTVTGEYPAGFDKGPAVGGYGDLINFNGEDWETLSGYGLDYNWNIEAHVLSFDGEHKKLPNSSDNVLQNRRADETSFEVPLKKTSKLIRNDFIELLGYNVYRDNVKINTSIITESHYLDEDLEMVSHTYYVTAVYSFCESEPSTEVVFQWPPPNVNDIYALPEVKIYQNSTTKQISIVSDKALKSLILFNYTGQIIEERNNLMTNEVTIDISPYHTGLYILKVITADGKVHSKSMVITN
jgi:hypothetical protein